MSFILANATVASLSPRQTRRAHIGISDGRIEWIDERMPEGAENVVDCRDRVIVPGNVCAHTHVYSALARGMPAPPRVPHNFPEILQFIWWRLDRALDESSIRSSGLIGALDAIRSGTTTLIDHHASPSYIDGSLDLLADAFEEVGVRGVLCYEVTDRGGSERATAGLRENERFLKENRRPRQAGLVGAHASFTLEDHTLERVAALAQSFDTGVHIHVAEDLCDQSDSLQRCGKRVAERLDEAAILHPRSIAAHGVHLDEAELARVQRSGSWLIHNCRSNLNNAVGRAPVLAFGSRSALGTDGIDADMFAESRGAYFRAREDSLDAYAEQFTDLLARGADLASQFFTEPIGPLEPGAAADLVILDYEPPTPLAGENLAWHWMFAFTPAVVESVLVGGEWVLRNREICSVDEERIRAEARNEAWKLWKRMESIPV